MRTHCFTCGYPVISRILGLVLIAASLLKAQQYAASLILPAHLPKERLLSAGGGAVACIELLLGLWLLIGISPKQTRWVTGLCFLIFLVVSLARALAGEDSCGCFGSVLVNPWITSSLDGIAVVALLLFRPAESDGSRTSSRTRRRLALGLLGLLTLVTGAWWVVGVKAARLEEQAGMVRLGSMVVLAPEEWIDRRFPLPRHIDIGDRLEIGDWLIVLYRHDCSSCRDQLPAFLAALRGVNPVAEHRAAVALIEVPSEGTSASLFADGSLDARGKLARGPQWVVQTPLFLRVRNGIVRAVAYSSKEALREIPLRNATERAD